MIGFEPQTFENGRECVTTTALSRVIPLEPKSFCGEE